MRAVLPVTALLSHVCPDTARVLLSVLGLVLTGGCVSQTPFDQVVQVGWHQAAQRGPADDTVAMGTLGRYGECGLLQLVEDDSAAVMVDGQCWALDAAGVAVRQSLWSPVRFACVVRFRADLVVGLPAGLTQAGLSALLDREVPDTNVICAVRVDGRFARVRSAAHGPTVTTHPPTGDTFEKVSGSLIGFRFPASSPDAFAPGLSLWILSHDRLTAGPATDFELVDGTLAIDVCDRCQVLLPAARRAFARLAE